MSTCSPCAASRSSVSAEPPEAVSSAHAQPRVFCVRVTALVYIPESSGISSQPLRTTPALIHTPFSGTPCEHAPISAPQVSVSLPGNDIPCVRSLFTAHGTNPAGVEYSHRISRGAPLSSWYGFRATAQRSAVRKSSDSSSCGPVSFISRYLPPHSSSAPNG